MVEGREETGVSILDVHFFERVARIGRKGPQGIVEVKKYILVLRGHKFTLKIEQGPDNNSPANHKKRRLKRAGSIVRFESCRLGLRHQCCLKDLFHLNDKVLGYAPELLRISNL